MTTGMVIKQLRESRKISVMELADKIGTTKQAIYDYESDRAVPRHKKLIEIAKVFDVSIDDLVKGNLDESKVSSKSQDNGQFGNEVVELLKQQLQEKDAQIERLQKMLMDLVGKSSGEPTARIAA